MSAQANVFYNRSKFKIGQLLGSGNFGSVYVGEAEGLFYPCSITKVAVKTVNDALGNNLTKPVLLQVRQSMSHFTDILNFVHGRFI